MSEKAIKHDFGPRPERYNSLAKIVIHEFDGFALLRNFNKTGFCMASRTFVSLTPGDRLTIKITPEETSGIPEFSLDVEVRWTRAREDVFTAGFKTESTSNTLLQQKYETYLQSLARR